MTDLNSEELEEEIEELLDPDHSDYELDAKLEIGRKYMLYCANSLDPSSIKLRDEIGLLKRFEEVFFAIQNIVQIFSSELHERITKIESSLNLSQNVVRLGMVNRRVSSPISFLRFLSSRTIELQIPESGYKKLSSQLLFDFKTALTRLAGMCGTASREAKRWWQTKEDNFVIEDFYDPRHVSKNYLKILIGEIKTSLQEDDQIPSGVIKQLNTELDEVVNELDKEKTSWNKVFSTVSQTVIVLAAVVTITANLDDAYQNAKKAFEYISNQSVSVPRVPDNNSKDIPKLSGIIENQEKKSSDQEE